MNDDTFKNKIHCELSITSHNFSSAQIIDETNIIPQRQFIKGDIVVSAHTQRTGKRLHNLWAISTENALSNEDNIARHIEYLKSLINGKEDIFRKYKNDPDTEVSFWIWIETEDAGIGFDLSEKELLLFNDIANRIHFSVITNTINQ